MDLTQRPSTFINLATAIPSLRIDLKYATDDNFTAQPITGYEQAECLLTRPAAEALAKVEWELVKNGLGLCVFDAYRPQHAVDALVAWTEDESQVGDKPNYYPDIDKSELFSRGYLVARSSHSRGSTVDLTIYDLATGELLDMGTRFDFFGTQSWITAQDISTQARANRLLLRSLMEGAGFVSFEYEWWHFTLADEPYKDTYFDFSL